jgi:hypothetical protein
VHVHVLGHDASHSDRPALRDRLRGSRCIH